MACPCPACGEHITPEIDDFKGFENCETSADAQENAYFECRLCGHHITAAERREMNRRGKLLHRGQTIDRDGNVHGDPPRTHIFAFRWNCFNNMFWSVEAIAHKAWQVAHAAEIADELESDPESIRKEWLQFYWAMPYEPPQLDDAPLQAKYVCKRKDADLDQFEIPEDTQYLVAGLDVHKRWIYYLVMAFCQSGKIHICDYDRVSVPSDIMTEQKAVRHALMELDDHLQKGFPIVGRGDRRLPDRAAVDTGYLTKDVFAFINAAGDNEVQYLGVKGFGISRKSGDFRSPYSAPKKIGQEVRLIGEEFHLARITKYRAFQMMVHSDYWIARLQNCLTLSMDASGAVSMFNAMEKSRHFRIATHFASHRWVNGKREIHGEDHWLDCGAYAFAAGRYLGYKFSVAEDDASRGATPPTHWFASARAGRGQHVPT
jgi:phage terminase large subunit GpA-like protein